jgi:hypothetical protein
MGFSKSLKQAREPAVYKPLPTSAHYSSFPRSHSATILRVFEVVYVSYDDSRIPGRHRHGFLLLLAGSSKSYMRASMGRGLFQRITRRVRCFAARECGNDVLAFPFSSPSKLRFRFMNGVWTFPKLYTGQLMFRAGSGGAARPGVENYARGRHGVLALFEVRKSDKYGWCAKTRC